MTEPSELPSYKKFLAATLTLASIVIAGLLQLLTTQFDELMRGFGGEMPAIYRLFVLIQPLLSAIGIVTVGFLIALFASDARA